LILNPQKNTAYNQDASLLTLSDDEIVKAIQTEALLVDELHEKTVKEETAELEQAISLSIALDKNQLDKDTPDFFEKKKKQKLVEVESEEDKEDDDAYWYKQVDRVEAEQLLRKEDFDCFLIRNSSQPGCFVLSMFNFAESNVFHIVIQPSSTGSLLLKEGKETREYNSLQDLVEGLENHPVWKMYQPISPPRKTSLSHEFQLDYDPKIEQIKEMERLQQIEIERQENDRKKREEEETIKRQEETIKRQEEEELKQKQEAELKKKLEADRNSWKKPESSPKPALKTSTESPKPVPKTESSPKPTLKTRSETPPKPTPLTKTTSADLSKTVPKPTPLRSISPNEEVSKSPRPVKKIPTNENSPSPRPQHKKKCFVFRTN